MRLQYRYAPWTYRDLTITAELVLSSAYHGIHSRLQDSSSSYSHCVVHRD